MLLSSSLSPCDIYWSLFDPEYGLPLRCFFATDLLTFYIIINSFQKQFFIYH